MPRRADTTSDPTRVSFPPAAWAAMAIVALLLVGGIFLQLALLRDQRSLARKQKLIAAQTLRELRPLVYDTRPLAREARRSLPAARRTGHRVDALTREATPLTADLRAADLPGVTRALGALARSLVEADSAASLRDLRRLVAEMSDTSLVPRVSHAAALAPRQYEIQRRTLRVQTQAISLQRQQLEIARQTLAIARATLTHAESLDRKTGGPAAAPAVPTVP
jgi:hypothetical protein